VASGERNVPNHLTKRESEHGKLMTDKNNSPIGGKQKLFLKGATPATNNQNSGESRRHKPAEKKGRKPDVQNRGMPPKKTGVTGGVE